MFIIGKQESPVVRQARTMQEFARKRAEERKADERYMIAAVSRYLEMLGQRPASLGDPETVQLYTDLLRSEEARNFAKAVIAAERADAQNLTGHRPGES